MYLIEFGLKAGKMIHYLCGMPSDVAHANGAHITSRYYIKKREMVHLQKTCNVSTNNKKQK